MTSWKKILTWFAVYLACVGFIGGGVYICITYFAQKTFYLSKKQWNPAEPKTQNFDPVRLEKALFYVDSRLPTARSLLVLRNGKTVVENYYWFGGPNQTDHLHSLNLPLLQILFGIAIDKQLIQGTEQPLSDFFPKHLMQTSSHGTRSLTLNHLLRSQAPLLWGDRNPDYWGLFYAPDQIEASLRVISRPQTRTQPARNLASAYLLSQVIQQVSGQSVFSFADRYLFKPLGINTYANDDDELARDPMVGFQLKALDLAKLGYLLAQEGIWEGRRIVSKEWVRWVFFNCPKAELDELPGGSWIKTDIRGYEGLVGLGEGGQYLVLVPGLQLVVVATSTSTFALPQANGHDRLLQLVIESVLPTSGKTKTVAKPEFKSETATDQYTDRIAPNFVFSTPVPHDILDFFHQFAGDIVSKDNRRIAANYARIYDHGRPSMFSRRRPWAISRLILGVVKPHLEYVYITKIRIENSRAYLRGRMKFDFSSAVGSQGGFPLENLIRLKGRWKWLGLPKKTAILDRDDYFDAELSAEHQNFVDDCSDPLLGKSGLFGHDCFTESFQSAEKKHDLFVQRLQPFLKGQLGTKLHVTGIQTVGAAYRVKGYIEGSALGELRLPDDLHIIKENGGWKWHSTIDTMHTAYKSTNTDLVGDY